MAVLANKLKIKDTNTNEQYELNCYTTQAEAEADGGKSFKIKNNNIECWVAMLPTSVTGQQYSTPMVVKSAGTNYYAQTEVNSMEIGEIRAFDADYQAKINGSVESNWTQIAPYAFYSVSITTASFPACTDIGSSAFDGCSSLTAVRFPACTTIARAAFANCIRLTTANFPVCTSIDYTAFANCDKLTTANFPACTNIGSFAFQNCNALTTVDFPACTTIGNSAFSYCTTLTTASFPACTDIGSFAFYRCYNLVSLYLLTSSVPTLGNSGAFSSTPIAGYSTSAGRYGSIFVKASLLTEFQNHNVWSWYFSRLSPIGYKLSILGVEAGTIGFLYGKEIEDFSTTYPYGEVTYSFYNPAWGKIEYSYTETRDDGEGTYTIVPPPHNTVTYQGIDNDIAAKITEITATYDGVTLILPNAFPIVLGLPLSTTEVTLNIKFDGYANVTSVENISSTTTITLTNPEVQTATQVVVDATNVPSTLTNGNNFDTSGGYIRSGSSSYYVNSGSSKGYIKFTTPSEITDDMYIEVVCHCQSEVNYDFGYITIDTTNKYPSRSKTKPANCIFFSYENNGTTDNTYRYAMSQLTPDTDYYINISYLKDSSGNTGEDRLMIKSISWWE